MKWQTNDAKQYRLNPKCFEKTKVRWGIFKKLSPTKLHSEHSAPLAANVRPLADVRDLNTALVNVVISPAYWQAVVGRS